MTEQALARYVATLSIWAYILIFIVTALGFAYIRLLTPFPEHSNILLPLLAFAFYLWTWGNAQLTHVQSIKRYRRIIGEMGRPQQTSGGDSSTRANAGIGTPQK